MSQYASIRTRTGYRMQSAVPKKPAVIHGILRANGLLLRGVVVKTYVVDDPEHPFILYGPVAVYCDVLAYSGTTTTRWKALKNVLVSQDAGGMHHGNIWKPRATTMNMNPLPVDIDSSLQPWAWDGDHVLIGFIDDSLNEPVILRGIPHPSVDIGNELKSVGNRIQMRLIDGDPSFWKHHGSFFGVEDDGSFTVDTTQANTGLLLPGCLETPPPVDGSGKAMFNLPQESSFSVVLNDTSGLIASPPTPLIPTCQLDVTAVPLPQIQLSAATVNTLQANGSGALATLTVGDGAVHPAIAETLQVFYTALKNKLSAATVGFDCHLHPTAMGPSGQPTIVVAAADWDTTINATQVSMPDVVVTP